MPESFPVCRILDFPSFIWRPSLLEFPSPMPESFPVLFRAFTTSWLNLQFPSFTLSQFHNTPQPSQFPSFTAGALLAQLQFPSFTAGALLAHEQFPSFNAFAHLTFPVLTVSQFHETGKVKCAKMKLGNSRQITLFLDVALWSSLIYDKVENSG